jgi:hypothetical protein
MNDDIAYKTLLISSLQSKCNALIPFAVGRSSFTKASHALDSLEADKTFMVNTKLFGLSMDGFKGTLMRLDVDSQMNGIVQVKYTAGIIITDYISYNVNDTVTFNVSGL